MSECCAQTLQLVTGLPTAPLGLTHDIICRLQHEAHELGRLEGVVGELGVVAEGWMVTLRKVTDNRTDVKNRPSGKKGKCAASGGTLLNLYMIDCWCGPDQKE